MKSGVGHWFLDGWIGDNINHAMDNINHAMEFLVDSGSSVTIMSHSLYHYAVPMGQLSW